MEGRGQSEMIMEIPQSMKLGQFYYSFCYTIIFSTSYVAGENTVRTVTYTDWQTRNGPVDKTVTQLVTPKVVVCDRYAWKVVTVDTWRRR